MNEIFKTLDDDELMSHGRWMRRLARRLVRDPAEADDVAQEAWMAMARQAKVRAKDMRAYLGAVVRRLARKRDRSARRRQQCEQSSPGQAPSPSPLDIEEALELQQVMAEELRQIAEPYRTTILLRYVEDLNSAQIAERLGIPAGTVRARLKRGLERLRERLDQRYQDRRSAWSLIALALPTGPFLPSWRHTIGVRIMNPWIFSGAVVGILMTGWSLSGAAGGGTSMEPRSAPVTPSLGSTVAMTAASSVLGSSSASPTSPGPASGAHRSSMAPPSMVPTVITDHDTRSVRVVRNGSGAPLPHFALTAVGRDEESPLVTDQDGIVSIPSDWTGEITLLAVDDPDFRNPEPPRCTVREDGAFPQDFAVDAGSTVSFTFGEGPQPPPAELRAHIGCLPDPTHVHNHARVRSGGGDEVRFVRFLPQLALPKHVSNIPLYLHLGSDDGTWIASAPIPGLQDEIELATPLDFERRAALWVHIDCEGGNLSLDTALHRVEDGEVLEDAHAAWSGGRGGYFYYLPEGEYEVRSGASGIETQTERVFLYAGDRRDQRFHFQRAEGLHDLRVVIESQTGTLALDHVTPVLVSDDPERPTSDAQYARPPREHSNAHLFSALVPGDYVIRLRGAEHLPSFDRGLECVVSSWQDEITFTCLDQGVRLYEVEVQVVDGASGAPIDGDRLGQGIGVATFSGSREHRHRIADEQGGATLGPYIEDSSLSLLVCGDGYRPKLVETPALRPCNQEDAPQVIRLEAGWGTLLHVDDVRGQPVVGVEVRLDGEPAGTTDHRGFLLLSRDDAPSKVELWRDGEHLELAEGSEVIDPEHSTCYSRWMRIQETP